MPTGLLCPLGSQAPAFAVWQYAAGSAAE